MPPDQTSEIPIPPVQVNAVPLPPEAEAYVFEVNVGEKREGHALAKLYDKIKLKSPDLAVEFGHYFRKDIGETLPALKDIDTQRQNRAEDVLKGIEKEIFQDGKEKAGHGWLRGSILPIAASMGATFSGRLAAERLEPLARNFDKAVNTVTSSPGEVDATGTIVKDALGVEISHVADLFENVSPPVIGAVVAASGSMAASGVRRMLGERAFSLWARYSHVEGRTRLGKVGRSLGRGAERWLMGNTLGLNGFKGNERVQRMANWVDPEGNITIDNKELDINKKGEVKKYLTEAYWYTKGTRALKDLGAYFKPKEEVRITKVLPRIELVLKKLESDLGPELDGFKNEMYKSLQQRERNRFWFQATELSGLSAVKSFFLVKGLSQASSYIGELLAHSKVAPHVETIQSSVATMTPPIAENVAKDLENVRDTILRETPKVGEHIGNAAESVSDQAAQVGTNIAEATQPIREQIGATGQGISEYASGVQQDASEALTNAQTQISSTVGPVIEQVSENLGEFKNDIWDRLDKFYDASVPKTREDILKLFGINIGQASTDVASDAAANLTHDEIVIGTQSFMSELAKHSPAEQAAMLKFIDELGGLNEFLLRIDENITQDFAEEVAKEAAAISRAKDLQ